MPRRRREIATGRHRPLTPTTISQVSTYDFVIYSCANGQQLKSLAVLDEYSWECLAIDVTDGISSGQVVEILTQLISV